MGNPHYISLKDSVQREEETCLNSVLAVNFFSLLRFFIEEQLCHLHKLLCRIVKLQYLPEVQKYQAHQLKQLSLFHRQKINV